MERPSKTMYYLGIAKAVAARSPCLRRKFGAIIVVDDAIVSTGYNGPARGVNNCELGCLKDVKKAPHYSGYEWCPAVHAEENAVINAARNGAMVKGGIMYVVGVKPSGELTESVPCRRCKRVLINAGIVKVVTMNERGEVIEYDVKDWVREDSEWCTPKRSNNRSMYDQNNKMHALPARNGQKLKPMHERCQVLDDNLMHGWYLNHR